MRRAFTLTRRRAFTLIELIISIGMIAILFSFSSLNHLSLQRKTTLSEQTKTISSDLRAQQIKAMTGDTGGSGTVSDYGVYLGSNAYTLFKGSTYNPADPGNYQISLPPTLTLMDITFINSQIVFQKGSGEILNFSNIANTFGVNDSALNGSKTFILNALGVITQIQ